MIIGNKEFPLGGHTYVMGILNVTPDSFSDGGKWNKMDAALKRAEEMLSEGADIIDVGGESTRPGYTRISDVEEIDRVTPVIEAIKARMDAIISIDTYKSAVARAAADAGADLINDIWGLKADEKMAGVIADYNLACCIMHNRENTEYTDFINDVYNDIKESLEIAKGAGIDNDRIILDPGIGFAKTYEENLKMLKYENSLRDFGLPLLLGTSRKSVIGLTLNVDKNQRLAGTLATTVLAVKDGYDFVRVHDVKENVMAIKMTEAILGVE